MAVDPAYGNSSGYFRDPTNGEDLSPDTPRVIQCELKDGKFVWPQVAAADGSMLLKIVYKYFTDEEKELYKQYRGRGSSSGETRTRSPSAKPKETVYKPVEKETPILERTLVSYNESDTSSKSTDEMIAESDTCFGVANIGGLLDALIGKRDGRVIYHIPRSLIPNNIFDMFCEAV